MKKEYIFKIINDEKNIKVKIPNINEVFRGYIAIEILKSIFDESIKGDSNLIFAPKEVLLKNIEDIFGAVSNLKKSFKFKGFSGDEYEFILDNHFEKKDYIKIEILKVEIEEDNEKSNISFKLDNLDSKTIIVLLIGIIYSLKEFTLDSLKKSIYNKYKIDNSIDFKNKCSNITEISEMDNSLSSTMEYLKNASLNTDNIRGLKTKCPKIIYKINDYIPSRILNYQLYENDYRDEICVYIGKSDLNGFYFLCCNSSSVNGSISYTGLMNKNELLKYIECNQNKNISDEIKYFKTLLISILAENIEILNSDIDIEITMLDNDYLYNVKLFDKILFSNLKELWSISDEMIKKAYYKTLN